MHETKIKEIEEERAALDRRSQADSTRSCSSRSGHRMCRQPGSTASSPPQFDAVAPNGRLLFVDEHADPRHEEWTDNPEITGR